MSASNDTQSIFYRAMYSGESPQETDLGTITRFRHGGQVKRYHTWPTLRDQNVAAHSHGVAMIIMVLTDYTASPYLLMAALSHDLAEAWTGDVPAVAKWRNAALKQALDAEEESVNNSLNINFEQVLDTEERLLLKAADMLELMFFAYEERALGNQSMDQIMKNGHDWMRDNIKQIATTSALRRSWQVAAYLACRYTLDLNGRCIVENV